MLHATIDTLHGFLLHESSLKVVTRPVMKLIRKELLCVKQEENPPNSPSIFSLTSMAEATILGTQILELLNLNPL